jgi:hypothetical protein
MNREKALAHASVGYCLVDRRVLADMPSFWSETRLHRASGFDGYVVLVRFYVLGADEPFWSLQGTYSDFDEAIRYLEMYVGRSVDSWMERGGFAEYENARFPDTGEDLYASMDRIRKLVRSGAIGLPGGAVYRAADDD